MSDRCYLRGLTPLGLFNTLMGCLFNRVLVQCNDVGTGKTVRWMWRKGTDFPPEPALLSVAVREPQAAWSPVGVLRLQPGDVLVVRLDYVVSSAEVEQIVRSLQQIFGPEQKVLVLDQNNMLDIIHVETPEVRRG